MLSLLPRAPEIKKNNSCREQLLPDLRTDIQHINLCERFLCTQLKYYSEGGVSYADKVTLRCVDCKLFYNLTQYGNKSDLGFRYYPEVGRIVEATDSVCATRSLGEFQCSLA